MADGTASSVKALQGVELDRFWDEFTAVMGGPDGLMTYRYLGTHAEAIDRHHATGSLRLRSDLRGPHGLLASPLTILVADVIGILDDAIAVPAPTQIALQILDDGAGVKTVYCIGEMFHEGRSQLFSRARLVDADDHRRVLAICRDAGVVMAPAPEGYHYVDPGPGVADSPSLPPLWQAFGALRRDDGRFELPELTGRIGSTSGSLHHGATQIVMEAAATEAATDAAGSDRLRVDHWHVTFSARGTIGPFGTSTEVVAVSDTLVAVESELYDRGNSRRIAAASAVFRRV
jgi:acyl-coenzyme A thioesterase PaaI-like protein